MISMFALGSDLPEVEVIRSALSENGTFENFLSANYGIIGIAVC